MSNKIYHQVSSYAKALCINPNYLKYYAFKFENHYSRVNQFSSLDQRVQDNINEFLFEVYGEEYRSVFYFPKVTGNGKCWVLDRHNEIIGAYSFGDQFNHEYFPAMGSVQFAQIGYNKLNQFHTLPNELKERFIAGLHERIKVKLRDGTERRIFPFFNPKLTHSNKCWFFDTANNNKVIIYRLGDQASKGRWMIDNEKQRYLDRAADYFSGCEAMSYFEELAKRNLSR